MTRCGTRYQPQAIGASEGGCLIAGHYCRRCVALLQICMAYSDSRILAGALAASLALFSCHSAFVPMRCSGEQTTCIANCKKNPDRSFLSVCVTNCGARQSICMKTGCWDSGVQKYCGLLKQ